ncbi:MAG: RuvB-like helicase [Acidilobus sp.]
MSEIQITPVKQARWSSVHSHIRGLGLDANGKAKFAADGMIGQTEAREAAGLIVELVKQGRLGGKGVLIVGPSGTGKTAIAVAMARELGEDTPFVAVNGSEVLAAENKTEFLMQSLRRAMGVRIKEVREVVTGVVTELKYLKKTSPFYPYPVLGGAKVTLETKDDSGTFTVGPEVAQQFQALGIRKGDVIMIDVETGDVRRLGRVKEKAERVFDIDVTGQVEIPSGKVRSRREIVRTLTLHDIDASLAAQRAAFTLFGFLREEATITDEIRSRTDELVKKLRDEGKAELVPGILFIDDAHMLDIEAFSFLTKAMESEFAPIIVLATNRGMTTIRGTDEVAPHGMPRDLLDRLLIITTKPYSPDEIREILKVRAEEEDVALSEDALALLTKIGAERSLRYAVQLLQPAKMVAERRGSSKVEASDVEYVSKLFADLKTSIEYVEKYKDLLLK